MRGRRGRQKMFKPYCFLFLNFFLKYFRTNPQKLKYIRVRKRAGQDIKRNKLKQKKRLQGIIWKYGKERLKQNIEASKKMGKKHIAVLPIRIIDIGIETAVYIADSPTIRDSCM